MIVTPMSEFKKVGKLFVQALKEPKISKGETNYNLVSYQRKQEEKDYYH